MTLKAAMASAPATGSVTTQASAISPTVHQRRAPSPRRRPTPVMAALETCVAEPAARRSCWSPRAGDERVAELSPRYRLGGTAGQGPGRLEVCAG
jgi:hypothetical protein